MLALLRILERYWPLMDGGAMVRKSGTGDFVVRDGSLCRAYGARAAGGSSNPALRAGLNCAAPLALVSVDRMGAAFEHETENCAGTPESGSGGRKQIPRFVRNDNSSAGILRHCKGGRIQRSGLSGI
jgi:hypothetical protein